MKKKGYPKMKVGKGGGVSKPNSRVPQGIKKTKKKGGY